MTPREKALAASDRTCKPFLAPEWDWGPGDAYLRTLTVGEEGTHQKWIDDNPTAGKEVRLARYFLLVVVNAAGEPHFTEADLPLLTQRSWPVVRRGIDEANALREATAKEVEEYRRNFPASRNGSLPSASPSPSASGT